MAKVLLNIPEPILKQVDKKAKMNHLSRSEAARIALSFWAEKGNDLIPPIERPGVREIIAEMDAIQRKAKPSKLSSVEWLRKDRESR
jgi:hypothetical protein